MKPISLTAFYCCGVRMRDAERDHPVCGDVYAKTFMNEEGLRVLEKFKDETAPNSSNVARHRIIDDFLRQELLDHPDLRVVIIGAGFDSRAYRLTGGSWFELDEPQVIAYKDERLPISECENELHRLPIDFANDSLEQKLSSIPGSGAVVVVVEGVFMYLDEETIRQLLQALRNVFPKHKLICDLMSRKFFEKYSRTIHEKLSGMGATFKFTADNPEATFLSSGYQRVDRVSVVETSLQFESRKVPKILLKTLLRTLVSGYSIYFFETQN